MEIATTDAEGPPMLFAGNRLSSPGIPEWSGPRNSVKCCSTPPISSSRSQDSGGHLVWPPGRAKDAAVPAGRGIPPPDRSIDRSANHVADPWGGARRDLFAMVGGRGLEPRTSCL